MRDDVQFALAVAARALVRFRGANPYEHMITARTETKMGTWPQPFGVFIAVGPVDIVAAIEEAAAESVRSDWEAKPDQLRKLADELEQHGLGAALALIRGQRS